MRDLVKVILLLLLSLASPQEASRNPSQTEDIIPGPDWKDCLNTAIENLKNVYNEKRSLVQAALEGHKDHLDDNDKDVLNEFTKQYQDNFEKMKGIMQELKDLMQNNMKIFDKEFSKVEKILDVPRNRFQSNERSLLGTAMENLKGGFQNLEDSANNMLNGVADLAQELASQKGQANQMRQN